MKQQGLSENSSYKIVALLITLILWIIILGSKEATIDKKVSADYPLSKDMAIVGAVPKEVTFRISGPRLTLQRFSESNEHLNIDLTAALEGQTTFHIHPDSIDLPPGVRVIGVSPSNVTVRLEKVVTLSVPVKANLTGQLPQDRHLVNVTVQPPGIEIAGVRSAVENFKFIKTEPVDLTGLESSLTKDVGLILDDPAVSGKKENHVRVDLTIK